MEGHTHELIFLQDLALVMVVSAITMIICHAVRLPIVLGYILAGLFIGPHTPPYSLIHDTQSIHTLSALGIIFLLFSIGLEFSFKKLAKVGAVAFVASTFEIILMIWIGYSIGNLLGWRQMDSLFLGAILSISSTTIIAKILMESKKVQEKFAQVILGILVVEDMWAIIIIAILSGIATTGGLTFTEISIAMIKVFIFITALIFAGFLFVPRFLRYIEKCNVNEMMVIITLGICLGASLLAAKTGFSIALGAFLIGAIFAETKQSHDIIQKMEPIKDMFTAIFFVSVGMLIDPMVIKEYWALIVLITLITIIGKVASCSLATFLTGHDSQTSLKIGLGLAQIGEFSFIIAQLGLDTKVTSHFLYPIAVSVSAITTISTPFLMNNSSWIIDRIKQFSPKPIVTLAGLYPSWLSKLQPKEVSERQKVVIYKTISRRLPKLFFYSMCFAAAYFLANKYKNIFSMDENIYWSIVLILSFPFFIGIAYNMDKIFWEGLFLNLIRSKSAVENAKETSEVFHNTIRFSAILLSGLILFLALSRIIPLIPLVVFLFTLILVSGTSFWRSATHHHEHLEETILSVFDAESFPDNEKNRSQREQLVDLIQTNYPLSFETQDFLLPLEQCGINCTIRELDLRSKTGASIVGIYREEESLPNPSATTQLLPGDVLLLIGNHDQIKTAMAYLQSLIKEKPSS